MFSHLRFSFLIKKEKLLVKLLNHALWKKWNNISWISIFRKTCELTIKRLKKNPSYCWKHWETVRFNVKLCTYLEKLPLWRRLLSRLLCCSKKGRNSNHSITELTSHLNAKAKKILNIFMHLSIFGNKKFRVAQLTLWDGIVF